MVECEKSVMESARQCVAVVLRASQFSGRRIQEFLLNGDFVFR